MHPNQKAASAEPEQVVVICDCGEEHPAVVVGDEQQLLEWTCPKTGELKRDVNA